MTLAGKLLGTEDGNVLGCINENPQNKIWAFNNTAFGRYFRLNERKSNLLIEIRAGFVTFLAVAYILSVNANIITASGGTCTSESCDGPDKSFACRFIGPGGTNPGYGRCLDETRKSLIAATATASLIASFIMGGLANMPLVVCPGMGLNAYFTYNVVGYYGTGNVAYKDALAAIFIEGWIFVVLSLTGVRQLLIKYLPRSLSLAMSVGIGCFLAYIGLQQGQGIGVVTIEQATLGTLGACPVEHRINTYLIKDPSLTGVCSNLSDPTVPNIGPPSSNYACDGHKMMDAPFWLGISGFALMCVLMSRGFKGAIIVGVLWTTIIAWIPGHAASYLGKTSRLPGGIGGNGNARWAYFKKVVAVPTLDATGAQLNFGGMGNGDVWVALITFLYIDFCDCTGTLFSMANYINNFIPGYVDEAKNFPRSIWAYTADGLGIVVGALVGTSPVTAYIESATGIREGGRTGLTALTAGSCFFVSLFFAPLLSSIPVFATGPALILVGALMMINAAKIDWNNIRIAVPAFLTIIVMPLTYSIAYGIIGGIISHILFFLIEKALDFLSSKTNGAFGANVPHEQIDGPEARETFRNEHLHDRDGSSEDSTRNAKINQIVEKDVEMQHNKV